MKKIYSIYDRQALTYNMPMFFSTEGEALRGFLDIVQDPRTTINAHPEDFSLYQLGTYDPAEGNIQPQEHPVKVCSATDLLRLQETQENE